MTSATSLRAKSLVGFFRHSFEHPTISLFPQVPGGVDEHGRRQPRFILGFVANFCIPPPLQADGLARHLNQTMRPARNKVPPKCFGFCILAHLTRQYPLFASYPFHKKPRMILSIFFMAYFFKGNVVIK
jgi:hypothetical protein